MSEEHPKFLVRTFGYVDLSLLEFFLNNHSERYEAKVIEPMETFVLVVLEKK